MLEKKQRQIAQTLRWQVKYIPTLFQHGLEKTNWLETVKQLRSVDKLLRRRGRRKERFKNFNWRFERKGSLFNMANPYKNYSFSLGEKERSIGFCRKGHEDDFSQAMIWVWSSHIKVTGMRQFHFPMHIHPTVEELGFTNI